jgi:hypothetical protein
MNESCDCRKPPCGHMEQCIARVGRHPNKMGCHLCGKPYVVRECPDCKEGSPPEHFYVVEWKGSLITCCYGEEAPSL